ncbi:hypothetical protein [Ancylobacter terrae]|uniref:hypothetical protein n=1 Tax=Ancylobacter sp. sgz301288 TaxID=3342077 RepID=UPI00385BAB1E
MSDIASAIRAEAGVAYLWQVWAAAGLEIALSVLAARWQARRRANMSGRAPSATRTSHFD